MVSESASRQSTSLVQALSDQNDGSAERWSQWQVRNVATSRKDAMRARVAFTVIFAVLAVWLGRLLLATSL